MTDVVTSEVGTTAPTALPKSTTPDDLLAMYDAEAKADAPAEAPKEAEAPALQAPPPPKEEEAPKEEAPKEEFSKTDIAPKNVIKAKLDGTDVNIPEDAELTHRINGKDVPFKVKDAVQAWAQKEEFERNMSRRVNTIASREKRWQADQETFKTKIGEVIQVARGGDFVSGIRALAKLAAGNSSLDIAEFEKQYFEQLDKINDVYSKLSPAERDKFFAERKAKDLEDEIKRRDEERAGAEQRTTLESRVKSLQQQLAISDNDFWDGYKILAESQVGEGKAFTNRDEITPETVAKYILAVRHEEKVLAAGEQVGVTDDAILDEVSRIAAPHPEWTVEDIKAVIEKSEVVKSAPPNVVENLNRKTKPSSGQVSSTKKKDGKTQGLDEEDLEFLYRQQPRSYRPAFR